MGYQSERYRPEQHYMRGPGPRWLEKYIARSGVGRMPGEGEGRKARTLGRSIELKLRRWVPTRWRSNRNAAATHENQWNLVDRLGPWWV